FAGWRKGREAEEVIGGGKQRCDGVGVGEPGDGGVGQVIEVVDAGGAELGEEFECSVGKLPNGASDRKQRCEGVGVGEPGDVGVGQVIEVVDAGGAELGEEFECSVGKLPNVA